MFSFNHEAETVRRLLPSENLFWSECPVENEVDGNSSRKNNRKNVHPTENFTFHSKLCISSFAITSHASHLLLANHNKRQSA